MDGNSLDLSQKKGKEAESSTAFNTRQSKMCTHEEFMITSQLLYLPHKSRLVWSILHTPRRCLFNILINTKPKKAENHETHSELGTISIVRHRNINLHIIRCAPPLELSLHLDHILYSTAFMAFYSSFDPNKGFDRGGEAIGHELKLAVRWDEGDGTIIFESG